MANHNIIDGEDQEALFDHSYQCPVLYYVQSPSTISHANSIDYKTNESTFLSPYRSSESFIPTHPTNPNRDIARLILSRYSSHGSNNTILHEKKISYDLQSHERNCSTENGENGLLRICGVEEQHNKDIDVEDDDEQDYGFEREIIRRRSTKNGCWRFFSFGTSSSCYWICLQISWRLMISIGAALLVFFLATKPPPPKMSIKIAGIPQFGLGEGIDHSGVTTKILTCNCSMDLEVDNKSKLFGLHIRPSTIEMSFGPLVFATSQGPKLYAESHGATTFNLYVGTKNKAMYGAGRSMQDMLESGEGLSLIIQLKLRSNFKVVWNLINLKFHHNVECILVLHERYIKGHPNQRYSTSCRIASTS